MGLTNTFMKAVEDENVKSIRIMMKDSLLVDPTFSEFLAMEKAAANVKGLYDEHDGEEFQTDAALWNNEYLDAQMVQAMWNFSHERIAHLKKIVRHLYPVTEESQQGMKNSSYQTKSTAKRSYQEQKREDQVSGRYRGKVIAGGAAAGGVVGGVIGMAASLSTAAVIGCIAGGAAVGGVAASYLSQEHGKD